MVLRISIRNSRELQATVLAIRTADSEVQKQIRAHTKAIATPEWKRALAEQSSLSASYRMQARVLVDTARVSVSNQNIKLSSATVGRPLSGGLSPKTGAAAAEFGADRSKRVSYSATRNGKTYPVRGRRTRAQLPPRNRKGWIFYPAAAQIIPRIASLWVQTAVRTFYEVVNRG